MQQVQLSVVAWSNLVLKKDPFSRTTSHFSGGRPRFCPVFEDGNTSAHIWASNLFDTVIECGYLLWGEAGGFRD